MNIRYIVAGLIALAIGAMATFAGGQVIFLGKEKDYFVISWLPYYNFTMGVITVFITAPLILRAAPLAKTLALATFAAHATVMTILLTVYRDVVADHSLKAMSIRLAAWVLVLALLYLPERCPVARRGSSS